MILATVFDGSLFYCMIYKQYDRYWLYDGISYKMNNKPDNII